MSKADRRGIWVSSEAVCPYYQSENRNMVMCHGYEPGSTVRLCFQHSEDCTRYKASYCKSYEYELCNIEYMLEMADEARGKK